MLIIYVKISCVIEKGNNTDQVELMNIDVISLFLLIINGQLFTVPI